MALHKHGRDVRLCYCGDERFDVDEDGCSAKELEAIELGYDRERAILEELEEERAQELRHPELRAWLDGEGEL